MKLLYEKNRLSNFRYKSTVFFKIKVHRPQCINPFKHACITELHFKQKYLLMFYRYVIDTAKNVSAKVHFVNKLSAEHIHAGSQPLR